MPDGVVQWFDPITGLGVVARRGRLFTVAVADIESSARRAGARVHFDVDTGPDGERAKNVVLRKGGRGARRHARAGALTGAHGMDTKGATPWQWAHSRSNLVRSSLPLDVMHMWARHVGGGELDAALSLYASDAQVHTPEATLTRNKHVHAFLAGSGLPGASSAVAAGDEDNSVVVEWHGVGPEQRAMTVRSRVEHGLIVEQWITEGERVAPREPDEEYAFPGSLVTHGAVGADVVDYAWRRLGPLFDVIAEPVRFVRIKLSLAPDPAIERPALAEVSVDIDGDVVRAHVAANRLIEAVDLLQRRLRDQLEHRSERRQALHRSSGMPGPGQWRHGDWSHERPEVFERPVDDRQLIRRKSFAIEEMTPDEAAFDMEQLDHDFYLFRELATGDDALLERDGHGYRLTRVHPSELGAHGLAIELTIETRTPPTLTVDEAIEALEATHQRFQFFVDATTGRGAVVYRRYDGHNGLISPM